MKQITLEYLASRVAYSIGPSGSGKGEIENCLRSLLPEIGFELIAKASGDCFRESSKTDPDFAAKMSAGNFAKTLGPVMEPLKKEMKKFVIDLMEGKDRLLLLDGFLRVPEFTDESGELIPSQVEQVAIGWSETLKELSEDPRYGCYIDSNLREALNSEESVYEVNVGYPFEFLSEDVSLRETMVGFVKSSNLIVVNVTKEDAEALMRIRIDGTLGKLISGLPKESESEKTGKLTELLNELRCLEQGKYKYTTVDGKREIKIDPTHEGRRLKPLYTFDKNLFDAQAKRVISEIHLLAGLGEGSTDANKVKDSVLNILISENIEVCPELKETIGLIRGDDMLFGSRLKRWGEYKDKAMKLLTDELGFTEMSREQSLREFGFVAPDGHKILRNGELNGFVIPNGPQMNISLIDFKRRAMMESINLIDGIRKSSVESEGGTSIERR